MTTSDRPTVEILGKVVAVLRQCRACGEWKELAHYLLLVNGTSAVGANVRVCAACRRA